MYAKGYRPHRNPIIDLVRRILGTTNALKHLQIGDIFRCMALKSHEVALDFGCATGYMTYEMARRCKKAYGIDISEVGRLYVPKNLRHRLTFIKSRGERTPFEDSFFDVILMSEVIPMIPEPKEFFQEVSRILKPGGRIITVNPIERKGVKKGYTSDRGIVSVMKKLKLAPDTYEEYTFKLQETFGTAFRQIPPSSYYYNLFTEFGYSVEKEEFSPSATAQELFEKIQFIAFCLGLPTFGYYYYLFYPVMKVVDLLDKKERGTGSIIVASKKS